MSRPRAPEFFSPLPLVAVGVLVLNDHVLKAALHNTFTGKLSDVVGCFFFPLFLSALLAEVTDWSSQRRVLLGAVATIALFAPVKLSVTAANAVSRAVELVSVPLGIGLQHITVDPTDLLALPMVLAAILYARKVNPCVVSSS